MKRILLFLASLVVLPFANSQTNTSALPHSDASLLCRKVNLFIGTANDYGQLAPGATVPFGMLQVCPDSHPRRHAGYDFEVARISGISINRLSGVGGRGCGGNVSLMPDAVGDSVCIVKSTEHASPGYYETMLSNGVQVRLTATHRMAVERYAFPEAVAPVLLLNPAASFDRVHRADYEVVSPELLEGCVIARNTCGRGHYHLYYRLHTDRPFQADTLADGRVRLSFALDKSRREVEVRIVVSTGLKDALDVLSDADVWQQDFATLRVDAAEQWSEVLGRVRVEGTPELQTLFYTSLYRVFHSPFKVTDEKVKTYLGTDGKKHEASWGDYYSSWSLWDTYRTKFPLITMLMPEQSKAIMASLAQLYTMRKEDWSTPYECVPTVRTEHAIATLLDALRKGVVSKKVLKKAYPGMVEEVGRLSLKSPDQCLEAASDFWALGELARELGKKADSQRWTRRGVQIFDSIWPKAFETIDPTYANGLYQGTRWQYRWAAPMFLDRMKAIVGERQLLDQLHTFFSERLYNQGNEPDIHVPFLFGRLGQPRKTGAVVHELLLDSIVHRYGGNDAYPQPFVGRAFRNAPRGYCPEMDEDDGTMSAWFVFAAMGLYPLVVGEPVYEVFSPVFDRIELQPGMAGAEKIVIRTAGRTHLRQDLQRVTWNGQELKQFQIDHAQLSRGGELVFWY